MFLFYYLISQKILRSNGNIEIQIERNEKVYDRYDFLQ